MNPLDMDNSIDDPIEMMNGDIMDALFYEGDRGLSYLGKYGLSDIPRYDVESQEDYLILSIKLKNEGYESLGNFGDPKIFQRDAKLLNDLKQTRNLVFTTAYNNTGQKLDDMIAVFAKDKDF